MAHRQPVVVGDLGRRPPGRGGLLRVGSATGSFVGAPGEDRHGAALGGPRRARRGPPIDAGGPAPRQSWHVGPARALGGPELALDRPPQLVEAGRPGAALALLAQHHRAGERARLEGAQLLVVAELHRHPERAASRGWRATWRPSWRSSISGEGMEQRRAARRRDRHRYCSGGPDERLLIDTWARRLSRVRLCRQRAHNDLRPSAWPTVSRGRHGCAPSRPRTPPRACC